MDRPQWRDGVVTDKGREMLSIIDDETGERYPIPPGERVGLAVGDRVSFTLRPRRWKGRYWVDRLLLRP